MSTVVVQVGQCGNQVGSAFWSAVSKDKASIDGRIFLHPDGHLRSVNVDSEPKVLHHLSRSLSIRSSNVVRGKRGRGTNWALGYYGTRQDNEDLLTTSMEAIRKEVERCGSFNSFLLLHSMSGGTGSGLGSRLCENLRDEYRLYNLVSCVVAPHASGESPLQDYNSLLCLASIYRNCDSIIWMDNDEVLSRLEKRSRRERQVSYENMNKHIAGCLAGMLLPTDTLTPPSGTSIGSELMEIVRCLTPLPSCKLINTNSIYNSKNNWDSQLSQLIHEYKSHNTSSASHNASVAPRCICNLLVARGDTHKTFPSYMAAMEAKIKTGYKSVSWNPFPVENWTSVCGEPRLTLASNTSSTTRAISRITERAQIKYDARAYIHWYHKYGATTTDFEEAFDTLKTVVTDYDEMTR